MREVSIYSASDLGQRNVEPVQITIAKPIPTDDIDGRTWEGDWRLRLEAQGAKLAETLINVLPGGTADQLLLCLLKHKVTLFAVSNVASNRQDVAQAIAAFLATKPTAEQRAQLLRNIAADLEVSL